MGGEFVRKLEDPAGTEGGNFAGAGALQETSTGCQRKNIAHFIEYFPFSVVIGGMKLRIQGLSSQRMCS